MVALCAASGVHPFTLEPLAPMKVLMVDCENSRKQSARKFRQLVARLEQMGCDPGDRLVYQSRPEGLDLSSPKDAAWLLNRVQVDQPGLLTIGPAYRLCPTVSDDDVVRKVLDAIDQARLRARCAVMLEAHPGQGQQWSKERDLRPKGSQLWRAWPESIRGLRRDDADPLLARMEFAGRGDRDARHWPQSMREGYDDELPWVAMTPEDADAKQSLRSVS
jgi:replicative DNA helicase